MLDGNMTVHTDGRNLTARDLRTCSLWDTFLNDIFLLYRSCVEILKKIDVISDIWNEKDFKHFKESGGNGDSFHSAVLISPLSMRIRNGQI